MLWKVYHLIIVSSYYRLLVLTFFLYSVPKVFVGTLFLNTSNDAKGTYLRAGYVLTVIFMGFLNACLVSIDDLFHDRITFYTHRRATVSLPQIFLQILANTLLHLKKIGLSVFTYKFFNIELQFYRTASYYISQVITSLPVGQIEAFFHCVLSYFLVGMNGNGGWGFFYFWALFALLTMCGASISRILAYSLPSPDVAQNLGPAVLLLFIMGACFSPQYKDLPSWLRWVAWISPTAYCYEGVIVAEVAGRNVQTESGAMSGSMWAQQNLGIPRIPYSTAPSGLSNEGLIMAFDIYMLIILTVVFEVIGCCMLHHSQKWYGPNTQRYQVSSGMALMAPPWKSSDTDAPATTEVDTGDVVDENSPIPSAPPAHLTARDTVYEVDVPIVEEDESTTKNSSVLDDEPVNAIITTREYGQKGRGAAKEWAIKRTIGEGALSSYHSISERTSKSEAASVEEPSEKITDLNPPEPGRLRLLSGITASFEPGTMTALMGSSGAGKSTLLDVLAGYKTGGHIQGKININGHPKTDQSWQAIVGYCEQGE